jgi:hypothetical protein
MLGSGWRALLKAHARTDSNNSYYGSELSSSQDSMLELAKLVIGDLYIKSQAWKTAPQDGQYFRIYS